MRYYLLLLSIYSIPFVFFIVLFTGDWSWWLVPIGIFGVYFGLGMISAYIDIKWYDDNYTTNILTNNKKGNVE